jgi:hypothetical protein
MAIEFQELLNKKLVDNRSQLAKRYDMSRARVTQLLNLLELAPEIQEHLLLLEDKKSVREFSERRLRSLLRLKCPLAQEKRFLEFTN